MRKSLLITSQAEGQEELVGVVSTAGHLAPEEPREVRDPELVYRDDLTEKRLLGNHALMAAIQDSREHPEKLVRRSRKRGPSS